ncbi:4525_t:CDS:2 [Racocetra persica]|uniref:4525_t:CDS:1 n=1 Tax=Racocetra persica TaxID=160502 RepID=A0ACA9KNN6_9GLOM|nr:4525_t:CDS:2 [Racocetra persica]
MEVASSPSSPIIEYYASEAMIIPNGHRYFDDNDVNGWNVLGFHEAWIHENKDEIKVKLSKVYVLLSTIVKMREAARLLANKASTSCISYVVHATTVCCSSECLFGCMTMPTKRTHGSEPDELGASVEYQRSAQEKLNYEQLDNISKYSYALNNAAVINLSNIIQPILPSDESLELETMNLTQTTEQISSGTFNSQPERMRTPPPRFPNINALLHTPNKRQMHDKGVIL